VGRVPPTLVRERRRDQRESEQAAAFWVGVSKHGVSGGPAWKARFSASIGRQGPRASVRLLKGLAYIFKR
jgi:hypothetical protein